MTAPATPALDAGMAYPAICESASELSAVGQRRFVVATIVRLVALAVAAVGGAAAWRFGNVDLFGWLGLLGFTAALGVEFYVLTARPDRLWHEGRAAAESAKTLTWRYACGGNPFPIELALPEANRALVSRLDEILVDLEYVPPPSASATEQVRPTMRKARESTFDERKSLYLEGRILDQEAWYREKANVNDRRAHLFTFLTILLEFSGIFGATLKAFGVFSVDALGIVGVTATGLTAWAQTKQYASNARAYAIAYHELASIRSEIEYITEAEWPRYIDDAEGAISREHTLWRASRGLLHGRATRAPHPSAGKRD
jgi:hypothetical protein